MNQEQWRRTMDQHRQQHQQMADQQRAGWKRMNDDWDRQARAAAGRTPDDEPATVGDRVGLVVGVVVLVLLVGGALIAWTQLGDEGGDERSTPPAERVDGGGAGNGPPVGGSRASEEVSPGGTGAVVVPALRGVSGADASEELGALGLAATFLYGDGDELCDDETSLESAVVVVDPRAGTEVAPGSTVTVHVARLDADDTVAVPDLSGETVAEARAHLQGAGLQLAEPAPADDVVVGWQDADECKRLTAGSPVGVAAEAP